MPPLPPWSPGPAPAGGQRHQRLPPKRTAALNLPQRRLINCRTVRVNPGSTSHFYFPPLSPVYILTSLQKTTNKQAPSGKEERAQQPGANSGFNKLGSMRFVAAGSAGRQAAEWGGAGRTRGTAAEPRSGRRFRPASGINRLFTKPAARRGRQRLVFSEIKPRLLNRTSMVALTINIITIITTTVIGL